MTAPQDVETLLTIDLEKLAKRVRIIVTFEGEPLYRALTVTARTMGGVEFTARYYGALKKRESIDAAVKRLKLKEQALTGLADILIKLTSLTKELAP